MTMQIHGPSKTLTAKEIRAYVNNPGFIVLEFGPVRFFLDDPQQCDWLIIAATEAKQLLIDNPAEPEDDEPAPAEAVAVLAESIADGTPLLVTDDAAGPESCGSAAPITGRPCDLDAGHSGMHAHALACWSRDEVTA